MQIISLQIRTNVLSPSLPPSLPPYLSLSPLKKISFGGRVLPHLLIQFLECIVIIDKSHIHSRKRTGFKKMRETHLFL